MVGIIHRREQVKVEPSNPLDKYFDPVTHIATEANFIKFLEEGIYTEDAIGYKVQLSNTADYNNGLWVIADVNHDSANTGQTNCYDLISEDCFYRTVFGSNQNWRSSTPRTWLNNTFYPGFSTEFKNHILNPKYNSQDTWYTDDKIILPSKVELNGGTSATSNEGIAYPIFTDANSRKKYQSGTSITGRWWTRSRYTGNNTYVWDVYTDGSTGRHGYSLNGYLAPILRVS